ncbi:MAG: M1 family metallopeptidase [Bacteroidia bacterium]
MKKLFGAFFLSIFISSCSLLGIHLKVENPKKAGAYPKETRQNDLLAKTTKYRSCFDVYHYQLNVKVDPEKKFISGNVIISSKAVNDFDTLQIDLYKNMKVKTIESNHQQLSYKRDEGAIFIQMPAHIKQNESFDIEIAFEGNPITARRPPWDGGFVWKKDKNGNPWIGVACETEGASLWFPNKDLMSDEADSTDVSITVPKKLMAVSNGILKDSTTSDPATNTYHWHISYPINNYDITIYVGNFKLLHDSYASTVTWKTLSLNHYVLPYNYGNAKLHFQQLKKYLAFYEKMFGPYPWQNDGFKLVESPYEGMEHQTAIAYGNGYKNDFEGIIDYIILHETAHEWWGNSVTAADLSDGWIHEGFATYAEALYIESIQGHEAYLDYLYNYRISIENKRPVVRPRGIRYFDYHDEDIYTKGAWVLHTLRTTLNNDSLFFDILKSFRIENNQKQILSETFIDFVNKKTGKDYSWFFKQYLFKREAPILEYYWDYETIYYRWTCTDDDFVLPVSIELDGRKVNLDPTTKIQKMDLKSGSRNSFYDNSTELYYGVKLNKKLPDLFNSNR